jgi:tRNA-2-methylthio-N6-dimethylallyladenosine synthase
MKKKKNLYIETYGCQMNFSDSEVVVSILKQDYQLVSHIEKAELILINTCSIRENAEKRVMNRLNEIKHLKKRNSKLKIGIIGCMAERMKESLFLNDLGVDLVFGPDAYRSLPEQLVVVNEGRTKRSIFS